MERKMYSLAMALIVAKRASGLPCASHHSQELNRLVLRSIEALRQSGSGAQTLSECVLAGESFTRKSGIILEIILINIIIYLYQLS